MVLRRLSLLRERFMAGIKSASIGNERNLSRVVYHCVDDGCAGDIE